MICAARADQRPDLERGYAVGALLQLTCVERNVVKSSILHWWPDELGKKIEPSLGEALPAFLLPQAKATVVLH